MVYKALTVLFLILGNNMRILTLAAAVAGLAIAGSASAATNLVINGSFESGNVAWDYTGSPGDGYPVAIIFYDQAAPHPIGAFGEAVTPDDSTSASPDAVGTRAAYFVGDFSNETLSQTIGPIAAGQYRVGFSAYAPQNGLNNAGDGTFTASVGGVQLLSAAVSTFAPQTWYNFSDTVFIGGPNSSAVFSFSTSQRPSNDMVIDRVYLIAVPEPATWGLMIGGFGLAGAALRRRRAVAA